MYPESTVMKGSSPKIVAASSLAIDISYINHTDIHANITHIRRFLPFNSYIKHVHTLNDGSTRLHNQFGIAEYAKPGSDVLSGLYPTVSSAGHIPYLQNSSFKRTDIIYNRVINQADSIKSYAQPNHIKLCIRKRSIPAVYRYASGFYAESSLQLFGSPFEYLNRPRVKHRTEENHSLQNGEYRTESVHSDSSTTISAQALLLRRNPNDACPYQV